MQKFIHVDMDAFYVSVEVRDNPALLNKPVAVGGKSSQRGVLSTCNYMAREYGVRSAMPTAMAKRMCPHLVIVPSRMRVYQEVSTTIQEIFSRYTNKIEPLSLDEAYLDVTHCRLFSGSATLIAQDIRRTILNETGLTASAGIAPLKFIAKIASDMNKPNGQCVVKPDQVQPFIDTLPLNKIPGVGKVTYAKLEGMGLRTGADIKQYELNRLTQHFGKMGLNLWNKCQGIDNRGVVTSRIRKSIAVERTFSSNISSQLELQQYLTDHLLPELNKRAQRHLNERKIDKLGIKIKFSDFRQTTKELKTNELKPDLLLSLLSEAWHRRNGKDARLLGLYIGFADSKSGHQQLSLELE